MTKYHIAFFHSESESFTNQVYAQTREHAVFLARMMLTSYNEHSLIKVVSFTIRKGRSK